MWKKRELWNTCIRIQIQLDPYGIPYCISSPGSGSVYCQSPRSGSVYCQRAGSGSVCRIYGSAMIPTMKKGSLPDSISLTRHWNRVVVWAVQGSFNAMDCPVPPGNVTLASEADRCLLLVDGILNLSLVLFIWKQKLYFNLYGVSATRSSPYTFLLSSQVGSTVDQYPKKIVSGSATSVADPYFLYRYGSKSWSGSRNLTIYGWIRIQERQ